MPQVLVPSRGHSWTEWKGLLLGLPMRFPPLHGEGLDHLVDLQARALVPNRLPHTSCNAWVAILAHGYGHSGAEVPDDHVMARPHSCGGQPPQAGSLVLPIGG